MYVSNLNPLHDDSDRKHPSPIDVQSKSTEEKLYNFEWF